MNKKPRVTFIIPTLNAADILPRCLSAIRSQRYPQNKIEIVVADGGSTDKTQKVAESFGARVIPNPETWHEPGKARASGVAKGELLFFTDADNVLGSQNWLSSMVKPYLENLKTVKGLLPQTEPPPGSHPLNRYLGHLFTDPFTWFIYQNAANPKDYRRLYQPLKITKDYLLYKFTAQNHPLFGLSQGVGTVATFKRESMGWSDDILSGIKLIMEGGIIAYVPNAPLYHYHVGGWKSFIQKYRMRIRNNLFVVIKGMGFANRERFMNRTRRMRKILFIPYALSIIGPTISAISLVHKKHDSVMVLHIPVSFVMALLIIYEWLRFQLLRKE
ncbi:hypothetical protein A3A79_04990 [Candidatus Gottesmanbacteria bacterium RIFCSPLOWO2_01_FULL_43_11b]|uniref:Glycosyltransferase 2-like domain-containing protein n=1 Tax=Candidatus Gottesmanbacteria bacterium RIFCSPLOWO2_01_FULL_43_11b TaxID=1798392 RepID=A0A1F6AII2_9BACT|nr:MAG: hypothetical protein A3A79_04990 [Candidatus Gottesmanbacteria bacterium RIFCSPLOWO2_01_FULL_43_11b]